VDGGGQLWGNKYLLAKGANIWRVCQQKHFLKTHSDKQK
jgi:hypothetical protein